MLLYELTSQAESDIRSIIRYTLEQHGEKQAFHYKNALQERFSAIAERNVHSRSLSERYSQVLVTRCEHHYIFYIHPEGNKPRIIAIFHERMDMLTRLKERLG
jgi:toxin ParE1/3/4